MWRFPVSCRKKKEGLNSVKYKNNLFTFQFLTSRPQYLYFSKDSADTNGIEIISY